MRRDTTIKPDKPRDLIWFFAGEVKNHRAKMIATLRHLTPNYIHLTKGWNSPSGLSIEEMQEYFGRAVFAPCPFGNINPDSFRIMEALESGCIPVTVEFLGRDYFQYVYGDHPFVVGKNWKDAAAMMRNILARPEVVAERQFRVKAWYADFKDRLSEDARSIVEGRFDRLVSEQFRYQVEGRSAEEWKKKFDRHFRPKSRIGTLVYGIVNHLGMA
jgi:hypothetical protein